MMQASSEPFQLGTPGTGTVNYLAAVLFAQQAGVKAQFIPYKGSGPLTTDHAGGHVKVGFNPIPPSRGAIESGLIRALAATSLKRSALFPDLPTVAEALPGYEAVLHYGIVAPAGTPKAVVTKLNAALRQAVSSEEMKHKLAADGTEPLASTPEEYAADIDKEETKWSAIVKKSGAKAE